MILAVGMRRPVMEEPRMWSLVIPFLFMMSVAGARQGLAAVPELLERAAWVGVKSEPDKNLGGEEAGNGQAARSRTATAGRREIARRPEDSDPESSRDEPSVDVNTCSYADLLRLPGIGPKKARAILEERGKRPFRGVHDLRRVKGIGPKTIQRLAPHVTTRPVKAGD